MSEPSYEETPVQVGDRIADQRIRRDDGSEVKLSEVIAGPTIIPIVRYYGCLPCRDFLFGLESARSGLDADSLRIVGVGKAADYQATYLMQNGIGYELLLDPEEHLYHALQLRRFGWWMMLDPRMWWRYLRSLRSSRQGKITNHPLQSPGVVILDEALTVIYLHRGESIGDYPPVDEVIRAARKLSPN